MKLRRWSACVCLLFVGVAGCEEVPGRILIIAANGDTVSARPVLIREHAVVMPNGNDALDLRLVLLAPPGAFRVVIERGFLPVERAR